jgi:hypothetical protein
VNFLGSLVLVLVGMAVMFAACWLLAGQAECHVVPSGASSCESAEYRQ